MSTLFDCTLCKAVIREEKYYEDEYIAVINTKNLKGHAARIMVVTKKHLEIVPLWLEKWMLDKLEEHGRWIFTYTYKFVIMSPIFGTVSNHAHFVASDLDCKSNDFEQILATPWIQVVQVRTWDKKLTESKKEF